MIVSLVDRYLIMDNEDGSSYTIAKLTEQVSEFIYLAKPYSPTTYEPFPDGEFFVNLNILSLMPDEDVMWPRFRVFLNLEKLQEFTESISESDVKVSKLVLIQKPH